MNVCDDNVGCNEVKNVMCFTTIPTLFVYFLYDHIPTFFYIFPEMFFITCLHTFFFTRVRVMYVPEAEPSGTWYIAR